MANDTQLFSADALVELALRTFMGCPMLPVGETEVDAAREGYEAAGLQQPNDVYRSVGFVLEIFSNGNYELADEALEHYAVVLVELSMRTDRNLDTSLDDLGQIIANNICNKLEQLLLEIPEVRAEIHRRTGLS